MGYESKIYVVNKHSFSWRDDNKVSASVIAMVDMSKCYPLSDVLRYKPATNCYFYADDGDTEIVSDRYDMPLTECSIHEAIEIVKTAMKENHYWRLDILLSTLQAVSQNLCDDTGTDTFAVLHYGY